MHRVVRETEVFYSFPFSFKSVLTYVLIRVILMSRSTRLEVKANETKRVSKAIEEDRLLLKERRRKPSNLGEPDHGQDFHHSTAPITGIADRHSGKYNEGRRAEIDSVPSPVERR